MGIRTRVLRSLFRPSELIPENSVYLAVPVVFCHKNKGWPALGQSDQAHHGIKLSPLHNWTRPYPNVYVAAYIVDENKGMNRTRAPGCLGRGCDEGSRYSPTRPLDSPQIKEEPEDEDVVSLELLGRDQVRTNQLILKSFLQIETPCMSILYSTLGTWEVLELH